MTIIINHKQLLIIEDSDCDHAADPCADKLCPLGARCVAAADGRSASCVCPRHCPQYGDHAASRPVCGSDNQDYKDQCEMRRSACERGVDIVVKYHGACDPCENLECVEPEVCQLEEERKPVCRCGDSCSLEFTPVCGSDGKTYSNECILRQESCRSKKNLRIIYRGTCNSGVNPCTSVICSLGEECVITKFGIAQCECPTDCEPVVRPVCGNNGQTYDSICHLRRASCLAKTDIKVAHNGQCGSSGPCSSHSCNQGAVCVERGGLPVCECPHCSAEFSPVCGSDGISYGNECKLRLESCQHMRNISILHDGLCGGCENKKCEHFSVCESDQQGEAHCICGKECLQDTKPVCGTDNVTYKNECELQKIACEKKLPLQIAYDGDCVLADLCKEIKCKHGARCEAGVCICPTNCPSLPEEPVCASNMETFANECEMQKQACLKKPPISLTVVFYGDCSDRLGPGMTTTPLTPGAIPQPSPKSTDTPREACSDIRCDYDATCDLGADGFPRCSCLFDCSHEPASQICGSDFRIYSSMCAMKMEACQRQEELRLRPLDLCQGMEVKPCNGEPPVMDPTTSQELDCGSGPKRQDCPSDSYCHQTPQFAKCCRKETGVYLSNCQDSWFGCCPDNKSPAQGPDNAGCPSMCGCNKIGSYSETCEANTEQCQCKPGVGGLKCDRCEPGYWGLPKINSGHQGCLPCGCSMMGSVREDCEQMTGRCVCKPGVQGHKCDTCTDPEQLLGHNGCISADSGEMATGMPSSCGELTCFMGAVCEESGGQARCVCTMTCPQESDQPQMVCGSDGQTFGSECQLKLYACRYQKDISVQAMGACTEDMLAGTEWPMRQWTSGIRFTEPEDVSSPLSKSTRHLLMPEQRQLYNRHGQEVNHFITPGKNRGVFQLSGNHATPATILAFTALLGDLCSSDAECSIPHSVCIAGACTCRFNYTQSLDRQHCIENKETSLPKVFACDSSPCANGGTCEDTDSGIFVCHCTKYFSGDLCADVLIPRTIEVAAFNGRSYVRLKKLKAYHKLSIEIEFKTYSNDGLLFYNQQHADGTGDFVSLAIVNGFVEFRYNLGSGPVVLTSLERVQLHKFHRIIAKRYQRDGILQMDNSEAVAGQSQGTLRALDLVEDAFVGYVPTSIKKVAENIGTNLGFSGCIRRLKIGRKVVELEEGRDWMVESVHDVVECGSNPCASLPCLNTATCLFTSETNFSCACTPHYTGSLCETRIDPCVVNPCVLGTSCEPLHQGGFTCKCQPDTDCHITKNEFAIPEFNGESYLEARKLENVGRAFALEVWFMSKTENGVLLYNGQLTTGRGDFIALNIVNRHLQFRFNLGSGIANLTTQERIQLGVWHIVRASRLDKDGVLQLDNGSVVHGMSGPPLNELNLDLPFYIGSVPNFTDTNRESGVLFGLIGAIQKVIVNGQSWTGLGLQGFKVGRHQGPPCPTSTNPCLNNGICIANLNNFICKCADGYSGDQCHLPAANDKPVRFNGDTFLEYMANTISGKSFNMSEHFNFTNLVDEYWDENDEEYEEAEDDMEDMYDEDDFVFFDEHRNRRRTQFEVSLRTVEANGLLLWLKRGKNPQGNFIAVAVTGGYAELNLKLGRHIPLLTVRSKVQVNDGEWHTLLIERWKRGGQIQVDNEVPDKVQAEFGKTLLNTNTQLWIGGAPSLPSGLPSAYYLNYNGCLQRLLVDKVSVNLLHLNTSLSLDRCEAL